MNSREFLQFANEEDITGALRAFLNHLKENVQDQVKDKPLEIEAYTSETGKDY